MSIASSLKTGTTAPRSPAEVARELGPALSSSYNASADEDVYVADNMARLKASGLVEAGVPRELGGGGADIDELAAMLRQLGSWPRQSQSIVNANNSSVKNGV